jgi:hypothetical protein
MYEAPKITTIGSLHDLTLIVNKALGPTDGIANINGLPAKTIS